MLTRTIIVLLLLCILLVKGDLDSNYAGIQALSTDKDLTSDEAPTESMKSVSADRPGTISFSSERVEAPGANQGAPPDPLVATANSVEDDERVNSEEGGKKRSSPRSAKPQSAAHTVRSPALPPPQPIVPQPKALARSRTSKRRSRKNRRQI